MRFNLASMENTGFVECIFCGKIISPSNMINGSCPDCAAKEIQN